MSRGSVLARGMLRNHARYRGRREINIVPMLDVMVILTFFLIFTAVFSRTNVLEVHLPGPGAAASTPRGFALEIILRRSGLQVADRNVGVLQTIPAAANGQDLARLTDYLANLKQRLPAETQAALLVAEDVDYDTIVQVMDAVRVRQTIDGGRVTRESLFTQISLGDAPT